MAVVAGVLLDHVEHDPAQVRRLAPPGAGHVEGGLDFPSATLSRKENQTFSLRWILLHMIEEYARHNGHADLLREAIDGVTGD